MTLLLGGNDMFSRPQLLQELFFFRIQFCGDPDADPHKLISPTVAVQMGKTPLPHSEHSSRRSSRVDRQIGLPGQRGDFNFSAKGCHREADVEVVDDIVAASREVLVRLLLDEDDQIARRTAALTCVSLSLQWNIVAFRDSGRDADLDRGFPGEAAFTMATCARFPYDATFTPAGGARRDVHELSEHRSRDLAQFAGSFALRTTGGACAGFCPRTAADIAFLLFLDLELFFDARGDFLEGQRELRF